MAEWTAIGVDVFSGGVVGAVDQVLQNQDEKRRRAAEASGQTFSKMKEYGTYYNYGVPILGILAAAMGWLKGEWAIRTVLAGSQLAGRKITYHMTKATQASPWRMAPPGGGAPPVPQMPKPGFEKAGIV
jgi:hypothetical protein